MAWWRLVEGWRRHVTWWRHQYVTDDFIPPKPPPDRPRKPPNILLPVIKTGNHQFELDWSEIRYTGKGTTQYHGWKILVAWIRFDSLQTRSQKRPVGPSVWLSEQVLYHQSNLDFFVLIPVPNWYWWKSYLWRKVICAHYRIRMNRNDKIFLALNTRIISSSIIH